MVKNIMSISPKDDTKKDGTVVFDLDQLLAEDKLYFRSPRDNSNLNNLDEDHVLNYQESAEEDVQTLLFESRFECGNLRKALHMGGRQYDLILTPDVNSDRHHQWFYFEVSFECFHTMNISCMYIVSVSVVIEKHFCLSLGF